VRAAIANGELVNYYQPKSERDERKVMGSNPWSAWRILRTEWCSSDQFIGVAKSTGLMTI